MQKIYIKITTVKLSRERKLRRYVTLTIKLCNDDTFFTYHNLFLAWEKKLNNSSEKVT
jgi:hypothetical protein